MLDKVFLFSQLSILAEYQRKLLSERYCYLKLILKKYISSVFIFCKVKCVYKLLIWATWDN